MLDSIGNDAAVCRLLGIHPSTLRRYRRDQQAPKAVMYALFWETPWGRETADINLINEARQFYSRAMVLESQLKRMKKQVEALEAELQGIRPLPAPVSMRLVGADMRASSALMLCCI